METQPAFCTNMATSMGDSPKGLDGPSVTLTIRLIMQGKEVGSIIGKKGDNIKKFREESGAKINISDGSCPERIVTVTGSTEAILKAFALISRKFEEVMDVQSQNSPGPCPGGPGGPGAPSSKPQVTLRLIVPASQCGSLIGKGGAKIKEIREITGATIQVASEMLPNSTERAVTVSGNADAITKCIYQICCVMMEVSPRTEAWQSSANVVSPALSLPYLPCAAQSPPKGATIPYRPKPAMPPVIFAGGQAYTIQGQYAIPHPDLTKLHQLALQHAPLLPGHNVGNLNPQALATLAATNSIRQPPGAPPAPSSPMASASATTSEMTIPNDLIGCIIGKGGTKINEIRQLSGASIKISNTEDGSKDRMVTISGTPESINLAQYLINTSMELHKNLTLDPASNPSSAASSMTLTSNPMAIPLNQLVKPPMSGMANACPSVAAASLYASDLNNFSSQNQARAKTLTNKLENGSKTKADRKFAPY